MAGRTVAHGFPPHTAAYIFQSPYILYMYAYINYYGSSDIWSDAKPTNQANPIIGQTTPEGGFHLTGSI